MEEIKGEKGKLNREVDKEINQSADTLLKGLTQALARMQDIQSEDKWNVSRTYDLSFLRSSERRSMQNDFDRRQKQEREESDEGVVSRGRDPGREGRSQSASPRRDEKSPTRTAMKVSSRTTSYEDLSPTSFPPGRPPPLAGRSSPYHTSSRSSPALEQHYSPERASSPIRPKSPYEFAERNGERDRDSSMSMSPERSRSRRRSEEPMELPRSPEKDAYERSRRNREKSPFEVERSRMERSVSPYERLQTNNVTERSRPEGDGPERMHQGIYSSSRNDSDKPHRPSSGFERPRVGPWLYNESERPSRSRTLSEQPTLSSGLPFQGHGRSNQFSNRPDVRRGFDGTDTVESNYRYTDGRRSPSHLDLAYSRSRPFRDRYVKDESQGDDDSEPKTLRGVTIDLRTAQKQLKEIKALTEDARTQLMLTEYKRDNTQKDLERMKEDLLRKKKQLKGCEDQLRFRMGDMRDTSNIDDQTEALLQENESLKHRLRQADGLELERDELVRQLELAKEDLFNEQKQARNRIEELKDEVENLTAQLDETKSPQSDFLDRIRKLELENAKLLADKEELAKGNHDGQKRGGRGEFEKRYVREVDKLRVESEDLLSKLRRVQNEAETVSKENALLRERIADLEDKLTKERSGKDGLMDDHKRSLQNLRKEMDTAMVQLRENLFLDKQQALEELRQSMEKTRRTDSTKSEEKLMQTVAEHQGALKKKDGELSELMDIIQKLEAEKERLEQRTKYEVQQKVEEALSQERQKIMADREWTVLREREQIQQENQVKVKDLANELEQERKQRERLREQINQTNKELEEQRIQNKQALHERMAAVSRAKDQVRHEMLSEIDKVKDKLKQEHRQEIYRLQDTIRKQEDELCQLRAERKLYLRPELENTLDRVERTIVNELNEEVRRNSGIIGIAAKKVDPRNFAVENEGFSSSGRGRTPTTAALNARKAHDKGEANLRSCNQELRNHVSQLKRELELQKTALIRVEKEKEDLAKNVKHQLEREKNKEAEKMKEKMLQIPAHDKMNGVSLHKPSNLMNVHYNNSNGIVPLQSQYYNPSGNVQRQEIERLEREIQKLAENQRRAMTVPARSSYDDLHTDKMITTLESRVKQLQDENDALRLGKYSSVSTPDLSNPVHYRSSLSPYRPSQQEKLVNFLEQRSKEGLLDSDTVAEHQQRSRNMMSQKMYEMTKLQNSLTDQAKELIHLGQSYQQLNNRYTPTRDLNATR